MARKMNVREIDIAKLVFHVVGMDNTGTIVLRQRLVRGADAEGSRVDPHTQCLYVGTQPDWAISGPGL